MNERCKSLCAVLLALALAGCSVMQPLAGGPAAWRNELRPGDAVQITTTDGRSLEFVVSEVTDAGLRGEGQAVSYEAIASLNRRETSTWRTVGLIFGILAAGALLGGSDSYGGGRSGEPGYP